VETLLKAPKTTTLTRFSWDDINGMGYEIHMGQTEIKNGDSMFQVHERNNVSCRCEDGCVVDGSRIMGTYMHGLFDSPGITRCWLKTIGLVNIEVSKTHGFAAKNKEYDLLAEHFEKYIDTERIIESLSSGVSL
jgi:adenosylcobyric acid synthase